MCMKTAVFWAVALCGPAEVYGRFRAALCLRHHHAYYT